MTSRDANLLGALTTTLADRLFAAMAEEVGVSGVAASVLVLIDAEQDITIEQLARVLGVAQPSMTRAVTVLESSGFIAKEPAVDKRSRVLRLTDAGQAMLVRMLSRRAALLEEAISAVAPEDAPVLSRALAAMLEAMPKRSDDRFRICRLCDEAACGPRANCPVERGSDKLG